MPEAPIDWGEIRVSLQFGELPEDNMPRLLAVCIREREELGATLIQVMRDIDAMKARILGEPCDAK